MTICDKIQTVGETLESNLNARGVSCTFGTGTGEKNILQMTNLITSSNLKGSADSIISISASRPYLLSGEKTDLIVKLTNGLGEPKANASVTISDGTSLYSGITNNLGIFTLYDVEVSADTTFTATYSSVSATCKVEYCLFVDYCTTTNNNDSGWFNTESYGTYSYTDNGRVDIGTTSSGYWRYTIRPNNNNYYTVPIKATFEVVDLAPNPAIWVNVQGTTLSSNSYDLNPSYCQSGDIVEVEISSTSAKWLINGTVKKTVTYSGATGYRIELGCYKSTSQYSSAPSLKIRNFRIKSL